MGSPERVGLGGGIFAWRVDYVEVAWSQKEITQQGPILDFHSFDEGKRAELFNRIENHSILWLVRAADVFDPTVFKARIPWGNASMDAPREMAWLGQREDYLWVMEAPIGVWVGVQKRLGLVGDDGIAAAIRDVAFTPGGHFRFQGLSADYLKALGIVAFPELRQVIEAKGDSLSAESLYNLFFPIGGIDDPKVTEWLLQKARSSTPAVARPALGALMSPPRLEAEDLYIKWAEEGESVDSCLDALRVIHSPRLVEVCAETKSRVLLKDPFFFDEYYEAVLEPKLAVGWKMPVELIEATQAVISGAQTKDQSKIDQGSATILAWSDKDAAQLAASDLARYGGKGVNWGPVEPIGYKLLVDLGVQIAHPSSIPKASPMAFPSAASFSGDSSFPQASSWKLELQPRR